MFTFKAKTKKLKLLYSEKKILPIIFVLVFFMTTSQFGLVFEKLHTTYL